ncbi:MAG TPA: DUF397 domain-containing protein [Actinoplanes sp.]
MDLTHAKWRKSTRSGANGSCVEVATNMPGGVAVRDTKDRGQGPILTFGAGEWHTFINTLKAGAFDFPV